MESVSMLCAAALLTLGFISLHGQRRSGTPHPHARSSLLGCEQLRYVTHLQFLGAGYTKSVVKAMLPRGLPVALKSVNEDGTDMRRCLEHSGDMDGCRELVSLKLIKEIDLLQQLQHPNIVKLQGHCREGTRVTAALEHGVPLQMIQLLQSPWEERFRVCLGLVRLLHYLSLSPLGSVALLDFQPPQFVLVDGELKLTDLDDAVVTEPACHTDSNCSLDFPLRNFSLPCSSQGICQGLNERKNLYNAYRYFFTYLLPHRAPPALKPMLNRIMNLTAELRGSVSDTLAAFEEVLHSYKSGLYLGNAPSSGMQDFTYVPGVRPVGSTDYACWPSYDHRACLLSVHSPGEAALICDQHSHCAGFVLSGQKTWTGRLLASFKSSFGSLAPDGNGAVYVKKATAVTPPP